MTIEEICEAIDASLTPEQRADLLDHLVLEDIQDDFADYYHSSQSDECAEPAHQITDTELEAQIAELEETVNAWKQEVDRLKIEMERLQQTITNFGLAYNNVCDSNRALQAEIVELEAEMDAWRQEANRLRALQEEGK